MGRVFTNPGSESQGTMKQELQRIETAIQQAQSSQPSRGMGGKSPTDPEISFTIVASTSAAPSTSGATSLPDLPSFAPLAKQPAMPPSAPPATSHPQNQPSRPGQAPAQPPPRRTVAGAESAEETGSATTASTSPTAKSNFSEPQLLRGLPRNKLPDFSQSRQITNPEFVKGLLRELDNRVTGWQQELQQVRLRIQDLYLEGPVIDGWLESQPSQPDASSTATIRHAEIDRLVDYVNEICQQAEQSNEPPGQTHYRLCGLNQDGHLWSRPCPPDKVPEVGLAIARYQRLRQLLAQKQSLENQLDQFAQALIHLHSLVMNL
jgi:hypothetical protein